LAYLRQRTLEILQEQAFDAVGQPTDATAYSQQTFQTLPPEQVTQAIETCAPDPDCRAEMERNPVPYEEPAHTTQISIDDVGVKQQKADRREPSPAAEERHSVHNTIAHIAHAGRTYVLSGIGVAQVLPFVLAFLLHNRLLTGNLVFLVDGQRTLYAAILRALAWFKPLQIVLDGYHLEERCKQQLSLAMKGKTWRNDLLERLLPCLWYGCVERAIALLKNVDLASVKDPAALDNLVGYLERNRPYLPCYAVRARLGLRNSSNRGEKANDLLVAQRQKHNGMSWSASGSAALAAVTAVVHNQGYSRWFKTATLAFAFAA
jgi:hypothetical protein